MTSQERVLTACAFRRPDRIPRCDGFWEFPDSWRQRLGSPEELTDITILAPAEGIRPTQARLLREEDGWIYERDTWGRVIRRSPNAYFVETLEVAVPEGADIDRVAFDPPDLEMRFSLGKATPEETNAALAQAKARHAVFGKTGGPYLRSTFVRGETSFLMDIAADPAWAQAIADRVGDHLTAVGVAQIRRWQLQETGIWIYDDIAYNNGPFFSPKAFERIFLPAYRRMIRAYKQAGARYVFFHSDGDVRPLLDMLVDAGIDGLNPLEPRAHMDAEKIRARYPRLILAGGMCNTDVLVNGPIDRIEAAARAIIDLGRDGGVIIGTHSISPEVPLEHFVAYHQTCRTWGQFAA